MSAKISYVFGDKKNSVVLLYDGTVMEVRNGEKTKWAAGEVRATWPSRDAWLSTLGREWKTVEEWVAAGKRAAGSGQGITLSPRLSYFMGQERATEAEIGAALDSYSKHHWLYRSNWMANTDGIFIDSFLLVLSGKKLLHIHTREEVLAGILALAPAPAPAPVPVEAPAVVAPVVVAPEEEVVIVDAVLPNVVAPLPNVVEAIPVNPANSMQYPSSFKELNGEYFDLLMESDKSKTYKLSRLTDFLTVCAMDEYAPYWRASMKSRHHMRARIMVWKEIGPCPAADAFLAAYPA